MLTGFIKNIFIIYLICIFHELGHILFINIFGYRVINIEILPIGTYTNIDKDINTSINKDILITLGGVLFQFILFIILYILKKNINYITYDMFIKYNSYIILFNILPIIPLDGSKLVRLILEKKLSFYISFKIYIIISIISLISFILITKNYYILLFLLFRNILEYKNFKYIYNRFIIERYINDTDYYKIINNSKNIKDLRKECFHFYLKNNRYLNEKKYIEKYYFN